LEITVTTRRTRDVWLPQAERVADAYKAIGGRAAEILAPQMADLSPQRAQVVVHLVLPDALRDSTSRRRVNRRRSRREPADQSDCPQ